MTKIAILHFLPLEYYPPVTNFIDTLLSHPSKRVNSIRIFSSTNTKRRKAYQIKQSKQKPANTYSIKIKRTPFPETQDKVVLRIVKYAFFNLYSLFGLIKQRPNNILYYETISAWPAYIYSRFFNRNCRIFIHNHEYADKNWYATTMKQVRYFYRLEKEWLYLRAVWNSQTNSDRLGLFHSDHPALKPSTLKVLPNYPPRKWKQEVEKNKKGERKNNTLKLVYVGSLSFQSTYLKELCEWVLSQNGKVQFDIFAYNLYQDVKSFLKCLNSPYINYCEQGIEYLDIPLTISKYDVGIIFYKAYSENVINCVSNKFYEYLACNLDVWFSTTMESTYQHIASNSFPKVIPVDFENLNKFDWQKAVDKEGCTYKPSEYYCEDVYNELIEEITK